MLKLVQLRSLLLTTIMRPVSAAQHNSVVSLLNEGYSHRQIQSRTGLGKGTVGRISKEVEGNKENHPGGRPSKLSTRDKQSIIRQITTGKLDNAVQATKFINSVISNPVSSETVRRTLKEAGLHSATKKKVPMLKASHRARRLKFARDHENWTVEDWKRVLWSDETKINRIGSDGKVYVWKARGEGVSDRTTTPTVKHGGGNNLMVWGCMGWNGVGKLVEVEGKMDAQQYCEILDEGMMESFEKLGMKEGERYFQQDNDPKHTSKLATTWFSDNDIIVTHWPAQSPDLNPIEHLWFYIKRKLLEYEVPPKGIHELWERVAKEWNEIPPEVCQSLIESMPRRVAAVIKAKGGHTKY
jgi:transposase